MITKQLPEGWKKVKVSDVCIKVIGGGTPSTQNNEYWQDGTIDWVTSADIYGIKDIRPRKKITLKAVKESTTNILPKGGIIIVTRVGLGKLAIAPYDLCFSQDSQGLILNEKVIDTAYALWFLSKAVQVFKYENRGTTISGVTKKQLIDLPLLLPPIPVQQAIVSKIEEIFSELEVGVNELKTALARLKIYRQAVLHHYLINPNWERVKLGKLIISGPQNGLYKPQSFYGLGNRIVRIDNFYDGVLNLEGSFRRVQIDLSELTLYKLNQDDILINRVNSMSHIGKCALVKGLTEGTVFESNIMRFALNTQVASTQFVVHYLTSPAGLEELRKNAKQAVNQASINQQDVKGVEMFLPDLATQTQIVSEIEARLSEADAMESTIRQELVRAENLRHSILKKAFEGKLFTDLIREVVIEEPTAQYQAVSKSLNSRSEQLSLF